VSSGPAVFISLDITSCTLVCTPAPTVPDIIRQCGEAGIIGLVVISAGFQKSGEDGRQLQAQVREAGSEFEAMRIVGPNCLGVMAPHARLNASFAADMPEAGRIAFVSQSGALCISVLDWALHENVGFSSFVSIGNMLDVSVGDLIDYFSEDTTTDAIILYVESIPQFGKRKLSRRPDRGNHSSADDVRSPQL